MITGIFASAVTRRIKLSEAETALRAMDTGQPAGVTVITEPTEVTYPSYDGNSTIRVLVSTVQDPDGFTVELNQLQEALH